MLFLFFNQKKNDYQKNKYTFSVKATFRHRLAIIRKMTKTILSIITIGLISCQNPSKEKTTNENVEISTLLNHNLKSEYARVNQVFLMDSVQIEKYRKQIHNYAKVHLGFCDQIELDSFDFEKLKENLAFDSEVESLIFQNSKLQPMSSAENQIDTLKLTMISQSVIINYSEFKIGCVIKKKYFVKEVHQHKWFHADYVLTMSMFIANKWDCTISIDLI